MVFRAERIYDENASVTTLNRLTRKIPIGFRHADKGLRLTYRESHISIPNLLDTNPQAMCLGGIPAPWRPRLSKIRTYTRPSSFTALSPKVSPKLFWSAMSCQLQHVAPCNRWRQLCNRPFSSWPGDPKKRKYKTDVWFMVSKEHYGRESD